MQPRSLSFPNKLISARARYEPSLMFMKFVRRQDRQFADRRRARQPSVKQKVKVTDMQKTTMNAKVAIVAMDVLTSFAPSFLRS